MRKILSPLLALIVLGGGAFVFRDEFGKPDSFRASDRPARLRSPYGQALMSQQELLDTPTVAEDSLIPDEFLRTVRAITAESKVEFLARRAHGSAEGWFDRHSLEIVCDERSGKLVRVEGSIDLGSLASHAASFVDKIREGAFFGTSHKEICAYRSVRIHSATPGQLPNRANALIEAEITLAGVTRPISIPVRTAMTDDRGLTLRGEFMLDRAAFGLPLEPRSADSVKNELVIRLDVRAGEPAWNTAGNSPRPDSIPAETAKPSGDPSTKGTSLGASN